MTRETVFLSSTLLKLSRRLACTILITAMFPFVMFAHNQTSAQSSNLEAATATRRVNRSPQRNNRLFRLLNLTADQRAQIRLIRERTEADRRWLVVRHTQAQRALDAAIYASNVDETVIEERAQALATAQGELIKLRALAELSVRRVLSEQQLETFLELRRQAQARRTAQTNDAEASDDNDAFRNQARKRFRRRQIASPVASPQ